MSLLLSEFITLQTAIESSNGVLPTTGWRQLQPLPDGVQDFYAQIKRLANSILSKNLMDEKGDVIDLDAMPKIQHNVNKDLFDQFGGSIFRSAVKFPGGTGTGRWINASAYGGPQVTAVSGTAFTVSAGGALPQNVLVYGRGFGTANDGLHVVGAGSTGTNLVAAGLVAQASPPAGATLEVVGIQGVSADITCTSTQLLSTALDFTTLGLNPYSWAWVGGGTAAAPGSLGFASANCRGLVRLNTIAAHAITFDLPSQAFTTDAGTGKTIQIFFGPWMRNVAGDHADYLRTSHSFELVLPGIGSGGVTDYVYPIGCGLSDLDISCALTDRAMATLGFVGYDVNDPSTTRQTGASTSLAPSGYQMLNTVGEMKRLRVTDQSGTVYLVDVESWKLAIKNNVKPYKKQGTFGAADLVYGKFNGELSIDGAIAQDDLWKSARLNTTLRFESLMRNTDCGILLDVPACAAMGTGPKFPANDLATFSPTLQMFRDPTSGFVCGATVFPYLPAS